MAGRYIEHNARLKAATMANDLVVVEPVLVQKIAEDKATAEHILQQLAQNELDVATKGASAQTDDLIVNKEAQNVAPTAIKSTPNFMKSMDANIHVLTTRVAQDWQRAASQSTKSLRPQQLPRRKQMVTAHSLQVGDIIMVERGLRLSATVFCLAQPPLYHKAC